MSVPSIQLVWRSLPRLQQLFSAFAPAISRRSRGTAQSPGFPSHGSQRNETAALPERRKWPGERRAYLWRATSSHRMLGHRARSSGVCAISIVAFGSRPTSASAVDTGWAGSSIIRKPASTRENLSRMDRGTTPRPRHRESTHQPEGNSRSGAGAHPAEAQHVRSPKRTRAERRYR